MAKYIVLQGFKDIETGERYEKGHEIEMTVKRADKAVKNLKRWKGDFLDRIDNKDENDKSEDTQETAFQDGIVEQIDNEEGN